MDGKALRDKLVGSKDERAVSPVIGVILMVAITVILAAVIATLVMDIGGNQDTPLNAHVSADVGSSDVTLTVTDPGDADHFVLRGEGINGEVALHDSASSGYSNRVTSGNNLDASTGSSVTYSATDLGGSGVDLGSGEVNIVAVDGDQEDNAGSFQAP